MNSFRNPSTKYTASLQGALYYARRRRIANSILASLTPWTSGLNVTAGQYVSSENGNSSWKATSNGLTGAKAPTGQGAFYDGASGSSGAVSWRRIDIMTLLTFLYRGAPTP